MAKETRQLKQFIFTLLFISFYFSIAAKHIVINPTQGKISLEQAANLRYENPDSALYLLKLFEEEYIRDKDTLSAIDAMMLQASIHGHSANYKDSYDNLWTALFLADKAGLQETKANVYKSIGNYYSFYNRKDEAILYLNKSLELNKQLVASGELSKEVLGESYYAFSSTYRIFGDPTHAKTYLDSCKIYHSLTKTSAFIDMQDAYLLNEEGKVDEALQIVDSIIPYVSENAPAFQVMVYTLKGDLYRNKNAFRDSENSYNKALEASATYHSHIDYTPIIYEKLSKLYLDNNDHVNAYKSLERFKELDTKFFDSRSDNNRSILEIQDEFREEKEKLQISAQKQRLAQLEQEKKVEFLEKTVLLGSIGSLILFGIFYFKQIQGKHINEKKLLRQEQELEIQKRNEIVELKNKELAASTLKLIEKDEFIDNLKEKLKSVNGSLNKEEINKIVGSMSYDTSDNWKEFEARFISVNKSFYEQLNERFPKLTQGDQKICALVKLNFSSKEMSKLLGISVESVHTTRYRLRKKLNLTRKENLKEFIASI